MTSDPPYGFRWRMRPILIDADLTAGVPWAAIRAAGYSRKFLLPAPMRLAHVSYSQSPQFLYVTGDRRNSIHTFWFGDEGGTGELTVVDGELAHVDCCGCSFTISAGVLEFSPHKPGAIRNSLGPQTELPRNSEELLLAAVAGDCPPSWMGETQ